MALNWLTISRQALGQNIQAFRDHLSHQVALAVAVKGNAYGHGLMETARVFVEAGVDYLCVNAIYEARSLRKAGITSPILVMGYVPEERLNEIVELECDLVVYRLEILEALGRLKKVVNVHLKIETGNHRQGILMEDLPDFIEVIKACKNLKLRGISTHFSNVEEGEAGQNYADFQLKKFKKAIQMVDRSGLKPDFKHCANTAATVLIPGTHYNFVRVGIGAYGLWPSDKVKELADKSGKRMDLSPALSWRTRVAQLKVVEKGALIGYDCTYKMPTDGLIAVLPVGYYDGFPRALSNVGEVLIRGKRAPIRGRVCMNMLMVEVTGVRGVTVEDEVVLIGRQGKDEITVEELAAHCNTINYELVTRINERIERRLA